MTIHIRPESRPSTAGTSVETNQSWVLDAACRDDPEPWTDSSDPNLKAWAISECLTRCPVIEQCRVAGRNEHHGIWAGIEKRPKKSTKRLKKEKA